MKRSLVLAAVGLLLAAPSAFAGPGEVTAVSVVPGPGRALMIFGHNPYFVIAALVICVLGTIATVNVYRRARREEGRTRHYWMIGCA